MSRRRFTRLALGPLLLAAAAWVGCESDLGSSTGGSAAGRSSRIISLNGAEYLLGASVSTSCNNRCNGLQPLGDINEDGYPDIVVALKRRTPNAMEDTWVEAYSGRDGKLLWSLQAKYDSVDPKQSYTFGPIAVFEDFDGDGVRDVYCCGRSRLRSAAMLVSGRNGDILGRNVIERKSAVDLPIRCQDFNADAVPDFLFSSNTRSPTITILSGKDFSQLAQLNELWPEAGDSRIEWVFPVYHDENGDEIPDCLMRRISPRTAADSSALYEYAVLDGKSFEVLRTFESPLPRATARTFFAVVDDLNGDRAGDFVFSCMTGGGPEGRQSLVRAISGADGAVIWDVGGDYRGVGTESWSVDTSTGETKSLGKDIGFGNPFVSWLDLNGDQVDDIVILTDSASSDGTQPALLVISGQTGEIISSLELGDRQGHLIRDGQMALIRMDSTHEPPAIAIAARSPDDDAVLAIFDGAPAR